MTHSYKVDLHTHSTLSHDGGISEGEYGLILASNLLHFIAITDHNEIDTALQLRQKYGERIIVGEEIMTREGEIIGLFLNKLIKPQLSLEDTIEQIKSQGGLVYVPHPGDRYRKGIGQKKLAQIIDQVDICEVYNQRSLETWINGPSQKIALTNNVAQSASSDAHGLTGIGRTYNLVPLKPSRENLKENLSRATFVIKRFEFAEILTPTRNKIKSLLS